MKAPTKSELVVELTAVREEVEHLGMLADSREREAGYQRREVEKSRRLFMELFDDYRTLKLRFQWLEDKATDVANACEDHLPEMVGALAEELGIEITEDQNHGDT